MKKLIATLFIAAIACPMLGGCETTGDPNQGGIFWSERKAQDRLAEREATLQRENRTANRAEAANRELE